MNTAMPKVHRAVLQAPAGLVRARGAQ